ncbi:MAG TPA: response regulator [Blastocatellia bacterium]|nr:response regulator [Blastocatellia bacterium]
MERPSDFDSCQNQRHNTQIEALSIMSNKNISTEPLTARRQTPIQQPVVLVVEEDEYSCELTKTVLEILGYEVVEAEDHSRAKLALEHVRPNLILINAILPGSDCLNLIRFIRESSNYCQIPIIVTSGIATLAYREQAYLAGCTSFIVKPYEAQKLSKLLERYCPNKEIPQ